MPTSVSRSPSPVPASQVRRSMSPPLETSEGGAQSQSTSLSMNPDQTEVSSHLTHRPRISLTGVGANQATALYPSELNIEEGSTNVLQGTTYRDMLRGNESQLPAGIGIRKRERPTSLSASNASQSGPVAKHARQISDPPSLESDTNSISTKGAAIDNRIMLREKIDYLQKLAATFLNKYDALIAKNLSKENANMLLKAHEDSKKQVEIIKLHPNIDASVIKDCGIGDMDQAAHIELEEYNLVRNELVHHDLPTFGYNAVISKLGDGPPHLLPKKNSNELIPEPPMPAS